MKERTEVSAQAAWVAALSEMHNPAFDAVNDAFKKDGKGAGYVTLAALTSAIRPVLAKHGLAAIQRVGGKIGTLELTTEIIHTSGTVVGVSEIVYPAPENPQKLAALVTYLRRTSLAALVGVVGEADDDGNAAATPTDHQELERRAREARRAALIERDVAIVNERPELTDQELERRVEAVRAKQGVERALAGKTPRPAKTSPSGTQITGTVAKVYENPLPKGGFVHKIQLEDTDMKLTAWEDLEGRDLIAVGKTYTFYGVQKDGKYGPEFTIKDFHEAAATEAAGGDIPF
jgi:hypothetical protein